MSLLDDKHYSSLLKIDVAINKHLDPPNPVLSPMSYGGGGGGGVQWRGNEQGLSARTATLQKL